MRKQILSTLLAFYMVVMLMPGEALAKEAPDSGTLGSNVTWSFDKSTGVLTISGSGSMEDFDWVFGKDDTVSPKAWQTLIQEEKVVKSIDIQTGITSIGQNAFAYFRDLESVTIPESVTTINDGAFSFSGLKAVTIPNSVTNIGAGAFSPCEKLTSIVVPNSVTTLGEGVFSACKSLTNATLPEGLTSISDSLFRGCTELAKVNIPASVTKIESAAFMYCSKLDSVEIPSGVSEIGDRAFWQCNLTGNLIIPNGVTTIPSAAFAQSKITSVTIPASVTSIKGGAFYGCDSLKDIYYVGSMEQWEQIEIENNPGGGPFGDSQVLFDVTKHFDYTESAERPSQPEVSSAAQSAAPTASTVLVNGEQKAFDAYNIGGNNYFKLRDLAYVLSGTEKQFEVSWDGAANAITLTPGAAYTTVGGEMTGKGTGTQNAAPSTSKILLDGKEVALTAYNIGGNNYFKLRDVGEVFDFGVGWDAASSTITIDTAQNYTPD